MHTILALDPATHCGVAIGYPGAKPTLGTVNFGREHDTHDDMFARALRWIERAAAGLYDIPPMAVCAAPPTILAIEAPVPPMNVRGFTNFDTTQVSLGLRAIFGGFARAHDMQILVAPIVSWRKYALGTGKLKGVEAKKQMVQLVRRLGWGDVDHNAAEACGIWLWACAQIAPQQTMRHEPLFATDIFRAGIR